MTSGGPRDKNDLKKQRRLGDDDSSSSSSSEDEGEEELQNDQDIRNDQDIQHDDRKKSLKEAWGRIMRDLKDEKLDKSKEAQEAFFKNHEAYLGPSPDWADWAQAEVAVHQRNVLCQLALDRKPELPHLVKLLVETYPALLEDTDASGQRAIDRAIEAKLEWFIQAVVESSIKKEDLGKALSAAKTSEGQVGNKSNCVHKVITADINAALTKKLVERAPSDLLVAQDNAGLTPLHHAVDYKRCAKGRVRVVKALLRCGDGALDQRTNPPQCYSAYRYHMDTRKQHEPKKPPKAPADQGERRTERKNERERERERERPGEDKKPAPGTEKEEKRLGPDLDEKKLKELRAGEAAKDRERGKETPRSGGLQRAATLNNMNMDVNVNVNGSVVVDGPAQANEGRQLSVNVPPLLVSDASTPMSPKQRIHAHTATPPNGSLTATTNPRPQAVTRRSGSKKHGGPSKSKADEVAKALKLAYFRSIFEFQAGHPDAVQRNHSSAEEFLYGDNKDCKAICFQFPPVQRKEPVKIEFDRFKESYHGFAFDPMLLYVDFGKFSLQVSEDPSDDRAAQKRQQRGPGRRDLVQFFRWLSKEKGVENIIKVSVDDEDDLPHCDEAIVESLKDFDIEVLDWRKTDLCPLAIQKACKNSPNIRELHLCWSGNNAVLTSWSAPGGLAGLPQLEQIHIYEIKPSLESLKRTEANLNDFEADLNEARKVVWEFDERVRLTSHRHDQLYGHPHGGQNPLGPGKHRPQRRIDEHQWLDIMDNFADAVRRVQKEKLSCFPNDYLTNPKLSPELREDVTVALIDDGVDFIHPAISGNLMPGRSFDSGLGLHDQQLGTPAPFHGSTTGHGTFMAYLIQRVCPSVKIFVYKIDVLPKDKEGDAVTFTAKSAADAVEDAASRGFDIISMSWSVQKNDGEDEALNNTEHLTRLKASLLKASNDLQGSQSKKLGKQTLLFCSAPDTGESNVKDTHYPFNCEGVPNMFKIGAAQVTGKAYPWTGTQVDWILPGENVGMRSSDMVRPIEDKLLRTGSSVATALAAGLAAMIIHCVRLGAVYNHYKNNGTGAGPRSVQAIKTFKAMKGVFGDIGNNDWAKGDRRLSVDPFFKSYVAELSKNAPEANAEKEKWREERWTNVAEIARGLLSDAREKQFAKGLPKAPL